MKSGLRLILLMTIPIVMLVGICQAGQFGSWLDSAKKMLSIPGGLSNDDVVNGLKEALQIGSGNAVSVVSKVDGYYKDPAIKIPLPKELQQFEKILRVVGYGHKVDDFELAMNRAAEKAAPGAKSILVDTVKEMQFRDAQMILKGPDNAATEYFKEKTSDRIIEAFKPIVRDSMNTVGVTRQFEEINSKLSSLPMGQKLSFDLPQYVTGKGLEGLFFMLALEEKKIRQNPAARTTELLKKVFANR